MKVEFNVHLECRPTRSYFLKRPMTVVTKPKPIFDRDVENLALEIAKLGRFTKSIEAASGKRTNVNEDVMLTSHNIVMLQEQFRNTIAETNPELKVHFKYGSGFVMVYTEDNNREQKFSGTFDFGAALCWLSQVLGWPVGARLIPDGRAIIEHIAARAKEITVKDLFSVSSLGNVSVDLTPENMSDAFNSLYREGGMPEFKVHEIRDGIYSAYYCEGEEQKAIPVKMLQEGDYFTLAIDIHLRGLEGENNG